ncbi:MAG: hypothetical protein HC893_09100 [Chloroflexaceae bacterium]|nr:hypothetical protein [Chloroflexaceae bacterium]NJL33979.1 hypothetical protein [Chloroflexaceae bacterium]NJO05986.1 hypothetical protein [Chloroflexaceae bacterium]NJO84703.1 hypothetical protein [Blastochloris sp.]
MRVLLSGIILGAASAALWRWYNHQTTQEGEATVHLQSEHEHFHLHVDLPTGMEVQPGDTVIIESLPQIEGDTHGEIAYISKVRLQKASWLRRNLIKQSSLVEIGELVEHP